MQIILGIGNPESRYQLNRHNVGFMFLDYFAQEHSLKFKPSKKDYYFCQGFIDSNKFYLIKPTTYVNNSGIAAKQILDLYNIDIKNFLLICDDINLITGKIRMRSSGGDGGHNGLASVIYHLNSDQFPRLRIGIGNDFEEGFLSDYVLSDFEEKEKNKLILTFKKASLLIKAFICGGVDAMFKVNSKLYNENNSSEIS